MSGTFRVKQLSKSNLEDFLSFFDDEAFADNSSWAFCYCQCFYEDHNKIVWANQTPSRNRQMACHRILNGSMQGYLCYVGDRPVGWCGAAPRNFFRALDEDPVPDAEKVGVIVCFLVAPAFRGNGVARALLDAACEGLALQGFEFAEAYPRPNAKSDAENYFGPLGLYLSSGFSIVQHDSDGSVRVRRTLGHRVGMTPNKASHQHPC